MEFPPGDTGLIISTNTYSALENIDVFEASFLSPKMLINIFYFS